MFDSTQDPNIAWQEMYKFFVKAADVCCPVKLFKIDSQRPPFITQEIVALINDRDFNFRKAKSLPMDSPDKAIYLANALSLRKEVNTRIKSSKRQYIEPI